MDDISISSHGKADRPFVRRMLELAALTTYTDLAQLGRVSLRERLDEIFDQHWANETKRIWIARLADGTPAGLVWVQTGVHPVTERQELLVLNVAVEAALRGRGIGRKLMAHARSYAEARGIKRLRLFVAADNAPALNLYGSLGFAERTREMVWELAP